MISFNEAHDLVINSARSFGNEVVSIDSCIGRILAEDILADRDFPPFDRVTKDGIAIAHKAFLDGKTTFKIEDVAAAGSPQKQLMDEDNCIEVMTGAMLPIGTDTVIMYEQLELDSGFATINTEPQKGQNIHYQGADRSLNSVLLPIDSYLRTTSIGVLATVGKSEVKVKKLPKVAIISTGNELVGINDTPEAHQLRSSNNLSLKMLLQQEGIESDIFQIRDDKIKIKNELQKLLPKYDTFMLSGGVSMGKFDFLPEVLMEIGVEKIFHKVAQRPGKPFWFGQHSQYMTTVFSFPGNPVSTYVNYQIYFKDWLRACLGTPTKNELVHINTHLNPNEDLTWFLLAQIDFQKSRTSANLVNNNGSGDLVSLTVATGVIEIPAGRQIEKGELMKYISF